jgi:hypothetical protein
MLYSLHAQASKKKCYKSIPAGELVRRKSIFISGDHELTIERSSRRRLLAALEYLRGA